MLRLTGIPAVLLWALLSSLSCLPLGTNAQETKPNSVDQYKPHGYVNDFAGIIDSRVQSQLDMICKDLDRKEKTQMAIVTVVSLDGLPIKEFATQLANRWGVGHKDTNRGILVLLCLKNRQYRISVGLGLESVLTDDEADRLGREMLPILRQGKYGNALLHLAKRIQIEIQQKIK
jgi:uncharacterized protein